MPWPPTGARGPTGHGWFPCVFPHGCEAQTRARRPVYFSSPSLPVQVRLRCTGFFLHLYISRAVGLRKAPSDVCDAEAQLGGMSLRHVLVCPLSTPGCPQSVPPRVICCGDSVHSTLAVCAVKHHPGMPPCHAVDRHPVARGPQLQRPREGGSSMALKRHHAEKARLQEVVPGLETCMLRTILTGVHVCCGGVGWLASVALDTCL